MFRDIGLSEWLISIDFESSDRVIETLERIEMDYDMVQRKVKRAMEFVHTRSAEMVTEIKQIVTKE